MTISSNIQIVELTRPALTNPVLIQGLPGLGFVGKIAVDFLIDQLKPIKFAELYSSYITLPDGDVGVQVELDSTFSLPKYEFYAFTQAPNLILLTGDAQPRPWGQYNVTLNILDFVEGFGCKTIVALGGYALRGRNEAVIYAIASKAGMVDDLEKRFNVRPAQSGMIKGAFGVMLGIGKGRNIQCLGLLGATTGTYPDLRASRNVVQLVANLFDLPIDLGGIEKRIQDMESRVEKFRDIRVTLPPRERREEGVPTGYIS